VTVQRKQTIPSRHFGHLFLLLHLGGPDTITAYSIEDNELWKRHLLGLVVQVGVAFYVFSRSWGSGILTFIAIPMFVVGIAKYAERTWVLRSSCSKSLKNSSLSQLFGIPIVVREYQKLLYKTSREIIFFKLMFFLIYPSL
jgi:hypothetical protein